MMTPQDTVDRLRRYLKSGIAGQEVFNVLREFQDDALESAAWVAQKRSKRIAQDIRAMKSRDQSCAN